MLIVTEDAALLASHRNRPPMPRARFGPPLVGGGGGGRGRTSTTTMRSERFSTKLEQIHARNFLKEAVEHALLANLKPFVKHLPNTCLFKNP